MDISVYSNITVKTIRPIQNRGSHLSLVEGQIEENEVFSEREEQSQFFLYSIAYVKGAYTPRNIYTSRI